MGTMTVLASALLPAVFLLVYIIRKDTKPEPSGKIVRAILLGVAIIFPVAVVEQMVDGLLFGAGGEPVTVAGNVVRAFCTAAVPEESFKLLALWIVLRNNPYFDEHFDGIVYAVCIGLGFAALENVTYVFGSGEFWLQTAVSRALLAVPGHYAFAVLMGYYYSKFHFSDHSFGTGACILLVPVVAHGVYDALAMSGSLDPVLGGLTTILLIWFCIRMHRRAKTKLLAMVEKDRSCVGS